MYKFRVFLIFFIIQYGFGSALPEYRAYRMTRNAAPANVNELASHLETRDLADTAVNESRAYYTPRPQVSSDIQIETPEVKPTKHHRFHFGCRDDNTERSIRSLESSKMSENAAPANVNELASHLETRDLADTAVNESRARAIIVSRPLLSSDNQIETPEVKPKTKPRRFHFGCRDEIDERSIRSLDTSNNLEENIELEVRQGQQGQPQSQPMTTQPQTTMPINQQMPQMQMQTPQMQMPQPQMQMPQPQMQMQSQPGNMQPQPVNMQPQPVNMQPQPSNMQPMTGGSMQMHLPDGQFHGPYQQPVMGYPVQTPYNTQGMGWPANPGNMPYPGNAIPPYSGYPPTGQMQLPVPPNQFNGYAPTSPFTNPMYNTPLSPSQNDLEAQIASAFITTQLSNMMRDPTTRESMLYLLSELRSFLSNPNSIPLMRTMNHHAQEVMNTPGLYGQQNVPHATSTIVQVQDGANHLMDKMKAKGGKLMSFVKDIAGTNSRMLEDVTADIPGVNSVVKIGTGLANAGVGLLDGFLSPWMHPSGGHGGTTITTVSTPQPAYPTTQYQTPTSITVGK